MDGGVEGGAFFEVAAADENVKGARGGLGGGKTVNFWMFFRFSVAEYTLDIVRLSVTIDEARLGDAFVGGAFSLSIDCLCRGASLLSCLLLNIDGERCLWGCFCLAYSIHRVYFLLLSEA